MTLIDQARTVLTLAGAAASDAPSRQRIADATQRLDEPLRVAVAGRVKAGKSTLVNAMVGEMIASTGARECTRVVTWYRDGVTYRVEGLAHDGSRHPLRFDRDGASLEIELGDQRPEDLDSIHVAWPSARLREMTLIDTPGIGSMTESHAGRAERFLSGGSERVTPSDAVLYLLRHVHVSDVRFLEAFHDDNMAAANPVNSLGLLSRADEIGAARPDAMISAERIAARWRSDRRLATLVQTVLPVAGLLAEGATTLRQAEFDALATLARADAPLVDELLVSVDRFGTSSAPVGIIDSERRVLLERFGLFGCRVALAQLRTDPALTAASLADRLLDVSGLPAVRSEIAHRFGRRRDLLKARVALLTAQHIATATGDAGLLSEIERTLGGAHEFAELRVINALRSGAVGFDSRRTESARRLLGEFGTTIAERAGLDDSAPEQSLRSALAESLGMWQSQAEHPLATPDTAAAARVLMRTCEGLLVATR